MGILKVDVGLPDLQEYLEAEETFKMFEAKNASGYEYYQPSTKKFFKSKKSIKFFIIGGPNRIQKLDVFLDQAKSHRNSLRSKILKYFDKRKEKADFKICTYKASKGILMYCFEHPIYANAKGKATNQVKETFEEREAFAEMLFKRLWNLDEAQYREARDFTVKEYKRIAALTPKKNFLDGLADFAPIAGAIILTAGVATPVVVAAGTAATKIAAGKGTQEDVLSVAAAALQTEVVQTQVAEVVQTVQPVIQQVKPAIDKIQSVVETTIEPIKNAVDTKIETVVSTLDKKIEEIKPEIKIETPAAVEVVKSSINAVEANFTLPAPTFVAPAAAPRPAPEALPAAVVQTSPAGNVSEAEKKPTAGAGALISILGYLLLG